MPQYLVICHDGTDDQASARRAAARPAHLDHVMPLVEAGHIVVGGAILDDAAAPAGSVAIVDFPSRADLDAWLAGDPYTTAGVWQSFDVRPMQIAVRAPA